jgi:hypothetical protein
MGGVVDTAQMLVVYSHQNLWEKAISVHQATQLAILKQLASFTPPSCGPIYWEITQIMIYISV